MRRAGPKSRARASLRAALLGAAAAGMACTTPGLVPVEDGRLLMGTVLDVSLLVPAERVLESRELLREIFDEVAALESLASRFDPDGALVRLNARAGEGAEPVDPRLEAMLRQAVRARERTSGAFDVTVGPLVLLWIDAAERDRAPSTDEIQAALARVGGPIVFEPEGRAALARPGMSVDLGGLAKGVALDRAVELLRADRVPRALLSFGRSSLWAGGQNWRLAIQSDDGDWLGMVELRDQALSMSSSLSQSSWIEGVRYGHVVDPRSGMALRERRLALVVADSATDAEVLSTALLVLDEDEGREVVAGYGAEAWVRSASGTSWHTPGWPRASGFRPLEAPPPRTGAATGASRADLRPGA